MPLSLYNSLTKKEEVFTPADGQTVKMYTCGPTVYGRPHIANYSAFLMADLLRRWLEVGHDWNVLYAKNITDVGHLVRDADSGEDKIEKQAREEHGEVSHESVIAIARKYEAMYLEDEAALNMLPLEKKFRPRATEYIEEMKLMIEVLLKNDHAYITDDGIYFDVTSKTLTPYGTLSGNSIDNLSAGARVDVNEQKKHPADFALWKFCVGHNEHHALRWPSPHGKNGETFAEGFPGWHIECSAMSRALLGDTLDIHTGGEDNIFPHHECEIAQSESVTGEQFVRFWLHKRRIDLAGEKMSKSIGNIVTVSDVMDKGFSPLDLRYMFLSVHYRTNLKFSWEELEKARQARKKITEWMDEVATWSDIPDEESGDEKFEAMSVHPFQEEFDDAMNSDLNVSAALAVVFDLMALSRNDKKLLTTSGKLELDRLIEKIRYTFGCFETEREVIPGDVQKLVDARAIARATKDFAGSDRLRDEIDALGYEVRDTKDGQVVKKK